MFMPFVGLTLAGATALQIGYRRLTHRYPNRLITYGAGVFVVVALAAYGVGTFIRNGVWSTNESLWADVVEKSPRNGRGRMNYAVALLSRGAHAEALVQLEAARELAPQYYLVHVNLGIVHGELSHLEDAEAAFRSAIVLQPARVESHFYYGRWLLRVGRPSEAIRELRRTLELQPDHEPARRLLAAARRASEAHR
jgi:Flp pilus assembly protein TadD